MSKRKQHLNQRLEELFSSEPAAEGKVLPSDTAAVPAKSTKAQPRPVDAEIAAVIEQMPVPVYIKDREHNWVAVNAALCQRLGHPASALLGHVDKEQMDEAWQADDRVLETGQIDQEQKSTPLPDGSLRVVNIRRVPLFDAEHRVSGLLGIIHETTTASEATRPVGTEDVFLQAVENVPSAVVISRVTDDVIVFANIAFSDLAGVPLDQLVGQPASIFYADPEVRQDVDKIFRRKGEVHAYEARMRHASGRVLWVSLDIRAMGFNGVACVITNMLDINARKEAETELAKFKLGIDRTNAAVTITDATGNILYVNPAYEQIYGYSPDEVIGKNPRILKSGYVSAEQYQRFWARLLAGEPVTGEIINKTKDGRLVPVETNNSPIQDDNGKTIGCLSIQYDISDRVRDQAELTKFKLGLDRSTSAIFITDLDGRITYANPAFEKIYGFTPEETIGQTPRILKSGRTSQEQYKRFWETLLAGQTITGEIVNKTKGGRLISIEGNNNPILNEKGEIIGFLGMHTDITERKQAEAEREQLLANEAKRALQLQTAAAISNAVSTVLNLDELLPFVVNLIQEQFELYYVGLFLVNAEGTQADLRAGTGEAGRLLLAQHQHLHLDENSMIGWSITHQRARIALDAGEDAVRFSNPLLPETRSEVALPLISRGEVLGAMTAQSREPNAFTDQDVAVLQSMADQVANAIANAELFEQNRVAQAEAETRLREVQFLQRVSQTISATLDLAHVYDVVFEALENELGFTHTALIVFDQKNDRAVTVRASGTASELQGLDRRMSDLKNDIVMLIAHSGQIEVIDGWDDRFDREIYERHGHQNLVRAFVPLLLRGESVGLLEVGYQRVERPRVTPEEVRLLGGLADQIAIAISNAQLFEETQRRVTEMSILNEISQVFAMSQSSEQLFQTIHAQVSRLFDTRNFYVATYDGSVEWTSAYHIENGERQPKASYRLGSGFTSHILRTGHPILINNLAENKAFHTEHGLAFVGNVAKSWMGVPLLASGKPAGVMGIQSYEQENLYHEHDLVLFSTIAAQAAIALQNTRLYEEARIRAEELTALNELSRTLATRLNMEQVLEEIHRGVARLLDATNFYVALHDVERKQVSFPIDTTQSEIDRGIETLSADEGMTGYIIRTRSSLLIKEDMEGWLNRTGLQQKGQIAQSWLGVPLLSSSQVLGVIALQSYTTERVYDERDLEILTAIAGQATIAIQNARLFEQIQKQASELAVFNEIIYEMSQSVELARVLGVAYQHIQELIPLDTFVVALYNPADHMVHYPLVYDNGQRYQPSSGPLRRDTMAGEVILTGQPLLINRTPEEIQALAVGHASESGQALGDNQRVPASLLYCPLKYEQRTIGAISAQSYQVNAYTARHQNLLARLANQLTVAIQNARLFEQAQQNTRDLAALNELARTISQQTEVVPMLEVTYQKLQNLIPVDTFLVGLYDEQSNTVTYPILYDEGQRYEVPSGPLNPGSGTGRAIRSGKAELILLTAEELARVTSVARAVGQVDKPSASLLYVPMQAGEKVIGALSVQSYQLNAYTEDHLRLIGAVASQTAVALQNVRLFEEARARARREQTLRDITARVRGSVDPETIVRVAVQDLGQALKRSTFIQLGSAEQLSSTGLATPPGFDDQTDVDNAHGSTPQGGK